MTIEWPLVRRAMLTQSNLFPENPRANCLSTLVGSEQLAVVHRCIRAFYQGLLWAERFGIQGGYVNNRSFRHIFLIEDCHILGVFDDRNSRRGETSPLPSHPTTTDELVKAYQRGRGNIKTLIVLEKDNDRLANSNAVGNQSKFLIDFVYPAIEGIRAQFSSAQSAEHWQTTVSQAQTAVSTGLSTEDPGSTALLHKSFLAEIYHDPQGADEKLVEQSPLQLFYGWNSPLNIEFPEEDALHQLMPWADNLCINPGSESLQHPPFKYSLKV